MNTAEQLALEGIEKVRRSNADWVDFVVGMIRIVAIRNETFTSADVWKYAGDARTDNRAMGAAFKVAASRGIIRATDEYRKTDRKECHGRPMRVWRRANA